MIFMNLKVSVMGNLKKKYLGGLDSEIEAAKLYD
jgi:hypothetical protein